jgi:hypothetical protein
MTRNSLRLTRVAAVIAAAAFALPAAARAQGAAPQPRAQSVTPPQRFEVRPFVGAYLPTGDQKDILDAGVLAGAQGAMHLTPYASLVGTVSYASSSDKALPTNAGVDLWQYDLGVEGHLTRSFANGVSLKPFAGVGGGGRSYDYRDHDGDVQNRLAGYGALGLGVSRGRLGARVEGRDYVSSFKGLRGELPDAKARNDVSLGAALTIGF